jgi:hypothetical protein
VDLLGCPVDTGRQGFSSTPDFALWLILLGLQSAVWLVALVPVAAKVRQRLGEVGAGRAERISVAVLIAALVLTFTIIAVSLYVFNFSSQDYPRIWPLPGHAWKIGVLTAIAFLVAAIAWFGIGLVGMLLWQMSRQKAAPSDDEVRRFTELRSDLNMLLAVAGLIIALGVLATGALRNAVLATNDVPLTCKTNKTNKACAPPDEKFNPTRIKDDKATSEIEKYKTTLQFDKKWILVYGLMLPLFLGIVFTPSYIALRYAARSLRDRTLKLPPPTAPTFSTVRDQQKQFDDYLQTKLTAMTSIKSALAILSPLAGSLIALAFGLPQ